MATLTLVQEHFHGGDDEFKVYATHEGGWGGAVVDLRGRSYSEGARSYTRIGTVVIPEDDFHRDFWSTDFIDWAGVIDANRARLQSLLDLHFRDTHTRVTI